MADLSKTQFADAVLRKLGVRPTPGARKAMVGWMNAEGGHWNNDARYNPLNTTQPEPGAGNTGSQGNIKQYRSWQQGVDATATTLKNGRYDGIISALRRGDPSAVASAIGSSPWGTSGDLVRRTIGSAPGGLQGPSKSILSSSDTASSDGGATTKTIPGVDNSGQRRTLFLDYLQNRDKDPNSFINLQLGLKQTQDTPPQTVTVKSGKEIGDDDLTGSLAEYVERANAFDRKNNQGKLPYQYGGGHGGKVDPTKAAVPVDCSGAVSAVLGINPRVAAQFKTFGSPGDGGNTGITVYAKDSHVLMKINGHFFGTSASNPGGGAGWIPANAVSPEYLRGFTARHLARV